MSQNTQFLVMVFIVVLLLSQSFVTPLMGAGAKARRRLRSRIQGLKSDPEALERTSLLRERYLRKLSPTARFFESLPALEPWRKLIEQAGKEYLVYHFMLAVLVSSIMPAALTWGLLGWRLEALLVAVAGGAAPFIWLLRVRSQRMAKFEEQLPEALSVMARSLQAGLPFSESMKVVGMEMSPPVSTEFQAVFNDVNYGGSVRNALFGLLERIPTVAVMAMVSAILIQRETGGNLAEVLDRLADLVRQRFRFQRSVKTLTAEGKMTAWVAALMPFGLGGMFYAVDPDWIKNLTEDPLGQKMVIFGFVWMVIGILVISKIVRIDV